MRIKIKSPLINRLIDKADDLFTKSSKILPPPKPIGKLRIYGRPITQLDAAVILLTILMGFGFWWYYGHWSMLAVAVLLTIGMWLIV